MPNESALHGETKGIITARFVLAIESAGLPCQVFTGEMAVDLGAATIFEPDVVVRCGPRLPPDALRVRDPVIAVEILSPSSRSRDFGRKQAAYLRIPSLHHYLVVDPEARTVMHVRRGSDDSFTTTIVRDRPITLDPPGVTIDRLFP
jgi:Uma2 family endonuclease